jgi:hypothetical protein
VLGFSVFLGDTFHQEKKNYVKEMFELGFRKVFTSLHIPEDDASQLFNNLKVLGSLTKSLNMELMADISVDGLKRLGIDLTQTNAIQELQELGVTGIRMDYGVSNETIASVSNLMSVGLNASTLTEKDVEELIKYQANFDQMELWHNYYPRPETGLSEEYFIKLNQKWQSLGAKIVAFVPGDENLRGPLHQGLPTLECHRKKHPLFAATDLLQTYHCDIVCIGDEGLQKRTKKQFKAYFYDKRIILHVCNVVKTHQDLFIGSHTNRLDDARDVIRSQEARFKQIPKIKANQTKQRKYGSVTLDNEHYLRYMGELQITKVNLKADKKVNVVAEVEESDLDLIQCILPGQQFELKESRNKCE